MYDEVLGEDVLRDQREHATTTRRAWMRNAGSGLVLAATGLFLPEWLQEAEAREGAYGGQLGGRHGKDQRGRDKRRRQPDREKRNRKRHKNKRLFLPVFFYVYNDRAVATPNQSASLVFWGGRQTSDIFPEFAWTKTDDRSLANGGVTQESYDPGLGLAVEIDGRYHVQALNPTVSLTTPVLLKYGGTMTKDGYVGGTTAINVNLDQNQGTGTTVEGHTFTINRLYDTKQYKVFDIHFS